MVFCWKHPGSTPKNVGRVAGSTACESSSYNIKRESDVFGGPRRPPQYVTKIQRWNTPGLLKILEF